MTVRDMPERERAESATRRLAAIVAASLDAVIGLDPDGLIESWNPGAEALFGRAPDEMIGQPLTALAPEDDYLPAPEIVAAVRRGERVRTELSAVHRDGTLLTVEATIASMRGGAGELLGYACVARDITDRKRDEYELQRFAQAATISARLAIISIDFDGRVHHWNAGAERLYGWSAAEAVGETIDTLTIETAEMHDGIARLRAGTLTEPREFRRRRKDGTYAYVLLWGGTWRRDGEPVGVTTIAMDVSERRSRERAIERWATHLERAQNMARLGSWTWDPRTDVTTWSPAMFEIYARDPRRGPASGAEALTYVHPEDRRRVAERLAETFGGGDSWKIEHRIIDGRGNVRHVSIVASADPDIPGGYFGTLQDITE